MLYSLQVQVGQHQKHPAAQYVQKTQKEESSNSQDWANKEEGKLKKKKLIYELYYIINFKNWRLKFFENII